MTRTAPSLAGGDRLGFLRAWLAEPLAIAAVAPSSRALTRLITSRIDIASAPVVELGPGTGVFTRAILDRGIAPRDLLLIERSPAFTLLLRRRFQDVDVVCDLAQHLALHVRSRLHERPGAVVSGLPLLAMPSTVQEEIVDAAFDVLRPGGAFYQFTYGHVPPVAAAVARRAGIGAVCIGRTLWNVPPASVYEIRRRVASRIRGPRATCLQQIQAGAGWISGT